MTPITDKNILKAICAAKPVALTLEERVAKLEAIVRREESAK